MSIEYFEIEEGIYYKEVVFSKEDIESTIGFCGQQGEDLYI